MIPFLRGDFLTKDFTLQKKQKYTKRGNVFYFTAQIILTIIVLAMLIYFSIVWFSNLIG